MTITAVDQFTGKTFVRPRRLHPELKELSKDRILADNVFAIKMHLQFFRWHSARRSANSGGKRVGLDGTLAAQVGDANMAAVNHFKQAGTELDKLMQPDPTIDMSWSGTEWKPYCVKRRSQFISALNIARRFRNNQIPDRADYRKFWEFFLPDEFLMAPNAYVILGI
jgi:hypothetical protein